VAWGWPPAASSCAGPTALANRRRLGLAEGARPLARNFPEPRGWGSQQLLSKVAARAATGVAGAAAGGSTGGPHGGAGGTGCVPPACEDGDGDGVPTHLDQCLFNAEDGRGSLPWDGCPDDDADGLPNSRDACRTKAEDGLGPQPEDGCPDADADGVRDDADLCPTKHEDQLPPNTHDGCPR